MIHYIHTHCIDTFSFNLTVSAAFAASPAELQAAPASQDIASPVKLQPVPASQVGNTTRHLTVSLAVTAVRSSAGAGIAAKAGAAADATGQLPHQQGSITLRAPCCCFDSSQPACSTHCTWGAQLQTRRCKSGLNGTHRQHSSTLYRHQHYVREGPGGRYSMHA